MVKGLRRVLSILLCCTLMVSYMPATSLWAGDSTVYAATQTVNINITDMPAGLNATIGWVHFGTDSWGGKQAQESHMQTLQDGPCTFDDSDRPSWWTVTESCICVKVGNPQAGYTYVKSGMVFAENGKYYQLKLTDNGSSMDVSIKEYSVSPGKPQTTGTVLGEVMDYGILANEMTITGHFETNFATKLLKNATGVNGPKTTGSGGYTYIGEYTGSGFQMGKGSTTGNPARDNDPTSRMVIYTTTDAQTRMGQSGVSDGVRIDTTYTKQEINDYIDGMMDLVKSNSTKMFNETNQIDVTMVVTKDPGGRGRKYVDIQTLSGGAPGTYYLQFDPGEYDSSWADATFNLGPDQNVVLNIPDTDVNLYRYFISRNGKEYDAGGDSSKDGASNGYSNYHAQTMIFNCPNATAARTAGAFDGTVIAPYATYDNNAVASGWLIVDKFNSNSSEWHLMYNDLPRTNGGNLVIKKTFAGDISASDLTEEQKESIKFTITGPSNYSRTITYDKFINGKYTLSGINVGEYTVTESNKVNITGYTLTVTGEGKYKVENGKSPVATITNTYEKPKGSLKLNKVVNGYNGTDKTYKFTVQDSNGKYVKEDGTLSTSKYEISVTAGTPVTISNMPLGKYTVAEDKTDAARTNYDLQVTGDGDVTISNSTPVSVTVTNNYTEHKGNLELNKSVSGYNGTDKTYKFTVKNPDSKYIDKDGKVSSTAVEISVTAGTPVEIKNLPVGNYTVSEVAASAARTDYSVSISDDVTATVKKGDTAVATITNTYTPKTGSADLKVKKTVTGNTYSLGEDFSFTLAEVDTNDKSGYTMPGSTGLTKTAKDGGTAAFDAITFKKSGTYYFTITETGGSTTGMDYDTAAKYAKVV
ncbi:MAG: hypothetical protein HUJ76_10665, partial [Parasporobacterium sp.]|nr:hypothetical protein [Parasporobacterium sp.]